MSCKPEGSERATTQESPSLLSPSATVGGSQQDVACDSSASMNLSDGISNELGLANGEDMHVPATKPEQMADYPWPTGFSDMGSFNAFISNSPKGLQPTKFDNLQDDFRLEISSHNQTYAGDQKPVGKAAGFSVVAQQTHSPIYRPSADLSLIESGKSNSAGLIEVSANAECSRAGTMSTDGLVGWPHSCITSQYNFGNASMCNPSMNPTHDECSSSPIKIRPSCYFQRADLYNKARSSN